MVLIKSLNLDSFKTVLTVLTVKKFLTVSIPKSQQSHLKSQFLSKSQSRVSIFVKVSIKSLNFGNFNIQVSTVKKFLEISLQRSMCDTQTDSFESNPIQMGFFVCGRERTKVVGGYIYIYLLARQICFAHLLCLQNIMFSFKNFTMASCQLNFVWLSDSYF